MRAHLAAALLLFAAASASAAPPDMRLQRMIDVLAALRAKRTSEAVFAPAFRAAIPDAQLAALVSQLEAQHGKLITAEDFRPDTPNSGRFTLRFERATATATFSIESAEPFRVTSLRLTSVTPIGDGAEKIAAEFAALPGRSGFAITRLGDGPPARVHAHNAGEQFAIGSTFKLWVLDALAGEIAAGRRRWDEVVRLGPRSLPGGITQAWPPQAPVTVETLATLMISLSDNTATDALIALVGRERVAERVRKTGHAAPSRMLPLLTTAEAFALKLGPADRRAAYAAADDAGQARLLGGIDTPKELAATSLAAPTGAPLAIDSIEWFASPDDIARVLDSLRRRDDPRVLPILGVVPHLDASQRERFAYVGYKGGSESGVLNLTWLLRDKAGAWIAVTASWNDPARALDNAKLDALGARLVAIVRQGSN